MNTKSKKLQRKEDLEEISRLESPITELKKQSQEWEEKYNQELDAEESGRLEAQDLEETIKGHAERQIILSQQLERVMKDTVVPIVAAVVMKAMYKKAVEISQPDQNAERQDDRLERIRNPRSQLEGEFGYNNTKQAAEFTDMWSEVIGELNTATREVTGDDVVAILPYCEERRRRVLERAFKSLWGISPGDWPNATPEQKGLVFRDCTDCEHDHLGQ
ncbi:hypothetical protein HOY80DRAFT_985997 [Tuber brumale]|nr:hypothetical protein HOY80DRAFT_985997 [Tuber brumale]